MHELQHGSIVLASITSCTNTSNEFAIIQAGLLAKRACELGLNFSPGSLVVIKYLENSGLNNYLEQLGFHVVGLGCMTCIGNSGNLITKELENIIIDSKLIAVSIISGNRNFSSRIHPLTKANYLASPSLVIAFAIAGNININLENTPLGKSSINGQEIFLKDILPEKEEIDQIIQQYVKSEIFIDNYQNLEKLESKQWKSLISQEKAVYEFDPNSSYIRLPPYFNDFSLQPPTISPLHSLRILLLLNDSISTDDISPVSTISSKSPAGEYLIQTYSQNINLHNFGARRGNHEVMIRGMFQNKTIGKQWENCKSVFDACQKAKQQGQGLIIIAGEEYGCGSSRDWAAKALSLNGVRAVIAKSFERIHRTNLIQMGILPLQFLEGNGWEKIGIKGTENVSILVENFQKVAVREIIQVQLDNEKIFDAMVRLDTEIEREYFNHGGIMQFVLRKLIKNQ